MPEPPPSCLPSPKCRGQSSPDEEVVQHPDWRKGKAWGGLGQLPSALGLGRPCAALGFPRLLPRDLLCPWWDFMWSKAFSRKLCRGGEEPRLPGWGSPGSEAGHLASPPKTAVESQALLGTSPGHGLAWRLPGAPEAAPSLAGHWDWGPGAQRALLSPMWPHL